jgi:hypothetical protein
VESHRLTLLQIFGSLFFAAAKKLEQAPADGMSENT